MTLATEVQARYPATRLVQLTNPGDESGTTLDATILGYAATDVQADFEIYAGVEYDGTDARHVSVAVEGVMAKLYQRTETPGSKADKLHDQYIERVRSLGKVTGRNRVTPTSSSVLTPTSEREGTETVRPDSDRPDFEDYVANAP